MHDSYEVFLTNLNDVFSHYLKSKNIVSFQSLPNDVLSNLFMD